MATYKELFHSSLNWKEKVLVMEQFHLLMLFKRSPWHLKDTAKYFKVSMALVSENISLAKNMDKIENCTSRDKALKCLKEK